jgi:hypothetical protein
MGPNYETAALLFLAATVYAATVYAAPLALSNESWAYVDVRPGAHMFYWLYQAETSNQSPLVMWLQGPSMDLIQFISMVRESLCLFFFCVCCRWPGSLLHGVRQL